VKVGEAGVTARALAASSGIPGRVITKARSLQKFFCKPGPRVLAVGDGAAWP